MHLSIEQSQKTAICSPSSTEIFWFVWNVNTINYLLHPRMNRRLILISMNNSALKPGLLKCIDFLNEDRELLKFNDSFSGDVRFDWFRKGCIQDFLSSSWLMWGMISYRKCTLITCCICLYFFFVILSILYGKSIMICMSILS